MEKYLFIGGPWDGKREAVKEGLKSVLIAVPKKWDAARAITDSAYSEHQYRMVMFDSGGCEIRAFASIDVKDSEIMGKLISGYCPKPLSTVVTNPP